MFAQAVQYLTGMTSEQMIEKNYELQKHKIKNKDQIEIIRMAKKYKWEYTWHMISEILVGVSPVLYCPNCVNNYRIITDLKTGNKVGFFVFGVYTDDIGKTELKYIFIKPGYRKKGYATQVIKGLRSDEEYERMYVDTKNPHMIALLNKLEFKEVGLCKNGVETCYLWTR